MEGQIRSDKERSGTDNLERPMSRQLITAQPTAVFRRLSKTFFKTQAVVTTVPAAATVLAIVLRMTPFQGYWRLFHSLRIDLMWPLCVFACAWMAPSIAYLAYRHDGRLGKYGLKSL